MKSYKLFTGFTKFFTCLSIAVFVSASIVFASTLADFTLNTVYTGFGTVDVNQVANTVQLTPMTATILSETHAGLVTSNENLTGDYEISMTVENLAQLRQNDPPNPWEAPWLVFGYNDALDSLGGPDQTFTYLILKPNGYGLELGEALTEDGQNFLWTSSVGDDSYDVGTSYDVIINVESGVITVTVDGVQKFVFSGARTLSLDGKFGFYSEDADVRFSNIQIQTTTPSSSPVNAIQGVQHSGKPKQRYVKRAYHYREPETKHLSLKAQIQQERELKQAALAERGPFPSLQDSAIRYLEPVRKK
ncbi:MAG: hypothetical protein Q8P68_01135 [Candidatus Peregrinibacteria bacterium]|nr:hypothetical protein [Candidatus Peregrinibacteria bacterium]MDZ4244326.1 hypothetical protein [Candidatus Gracilibacteria bacterium]